MGKGGALSIVALGLAAAIAFAAPGCGDTNEDEKQSTQASQTQTNASKTKPQPSEPETRPKPARRIPPSPQFKRVLSSLKSAAITGGTYKAIRRSNSLNPEENSVIDAFCETAWQLEINGEEAKLDIDEYIVGRIRSLANFNLTTPESGGGRNPNQALVTGSMEELRKVVGLAALDAELNHDYKKACYQ